MKHPMTRAEWNAYRKYIMRKAECTEWMEAILLLVNEIDALRLLLPVPGEKTRKQ